MNEQVTELMNAMQELYKKMDKVQEMLNLMDEQIIILEKNYNFVPEKPANV